MAEAPAADPALRVLREADVRALIDAEGALQAVRGAFLALHRGQAMLPEVMSFDFLEHRGEAHVKGSWLGEGHPLWTVKAATGFAGNPGCGLPAIGGLSLTLSATTGRPDTLILDNGWLTELRTGAAGALAADLLAPSALERVAILGTGRQAFFQLDALRCVRAVEHVVLWGRNGEHTEARAADLRARLGVDVEVAGSAERAVREADLLITVTAAREPILRSEWISQGAHVTAVGSDLPAKQELPAELLARADLLVVDDVAQAATQGELHHAIEAGLLSREDAVPLGALVAGEHLRRGGAGELTIADLTGVGVQDAAVAGAVAARAAERGLGTVLEA